MINTYSISVDGHVFETSSMATVRHIINSYVPDLSLVGVSSEIVVCQWNDSKGEYERKLRVTSVLTNGSVNKTWRTYVASLMPEQKEKLLIVLLERFIDQYGRNSEIHYCDGSNPYEDENPRLECLYWDSCGEPLI